MLVAIVVWFGWLVGRIPVTDGTGVFCYKFLFFSRFLPLRVSLFLLETLLEFIVWVTGFLSLPLSSFPFIFYRCATHLLPVKYIREWAFSENSARLRVNGIPIEMINRSDSFES